MRRSVFVAALVAAVVAVVASGAVAVGAVVLPLAESQAAGIRPIAGGARIDEAGSLGEASKTDGEGAGEGIVPGSSGWMTITLAPGHDELVCNMAGHYTAGMFTQLTVA